MKKIIDIVKEELINIFKNEKICVLQEIRFKDNIWCGKCVVNKKNMFVKYFVGNVYNNEDEFYKIFKQYGILTSRCFYCNKNLIILEDLTCTKNCRLARIEDLENIEIVKSLALWYKNLHCKGKIILRDAEQFKMHFNDLLYCEMKYGSKESVLKLIDRLPDCENLKYYINSIERFLNLDDYCYDRNNFNFTITYNDFAIENMAIKDNNVFMFDYNMVGKGLAYFDLQNVCYALNKKMKDLFLKTYGAFNEREVLVYNVLNPLITLSIAFSKSEFPKWAKNAIEEIYSKKYKSDIDKLLKLLVVK